jgi:N-acetylglucosamine kinase-like BadF-type ATPase
MPDKKIIIGIDGGGTKTRCVLFDANGNTIDILKGSGSNLYVYKDEGISVILDLINSILKNNKLSILDVDAFGIAVAGISDFDQKEILLKELDRLNITNKTILLSDVEASYKILCPNNTGLLVNIGTGIICFAKDENAKIVKEAGNGHDKGDLGSGYWLGKELFYKLILNEALVFEDEDLNQIFNITIDHFKVETFRDLYSKIEKGDNIFYQLALMGEDTIKLAELGNDVALSVIQEATRYVSDYILRMCERLDILTSNDIIIAINGSIIKNNFYRQLLEEALQFDFNKIHWVSSSISPAYGAGMIAANYNDISVSVKNIINKNKS